MLYEIKYLFYRLVILVSVIITLCTDNKIVNRIFIATLFLSAQCLIRYCIHDYLMIKDMRKKYIASWFKQLDLHIRMVLSLLAFYYALYLNLKYDIALSITCFFVFNIWFYRIVKNGATIRDKQAGQMIALVRKLQPKK